MKRVQMLMMLLCLLLLMGGCAEPEPVQTPTTAFSAGREPIVTIVWQPTETFYISPEYRETVEAAPNSVSEYFYEDAELQAAISGCCTDLLPLDSNDKILEYAYRMHEIFTERNLYPADQFPVTATHYSDGVWRFRIAKNDLPDLSIGGAGIIYAAESDGHIIDFLTGP